MHLLERSLKNRICEVVNQGDGPLAYNDQSWEELTGRLLEKVDVYREEARNARAAKRDLEAKVEDLEGDVDDLRSDLARERSE